MTTKTTMWEVYNPSSGHSLGHYKAESSEEAIEACCRAAGYGSEAEASAATGGRGVLRALEVEEVDLNTDNGSKTRAYLDESGFATFEHANAAGDRMIVKAKGNCLEIVPASGCCLKSNVEHAGRAVYIWVQPC